MGTFLILIIAVFVTFSLEWYWFSAILGLAALAHLVPDKKKKNKSRKAIKVSTKVTAAKSSSAQSAKRTKLKRAVELKKTDLPKAIELVREAYEDGEATSLQEFLRLPNYLRLNKQYDEAFQECCKLGSYGTPVEPEIPDSMGWYNEQCEIQSLSAKILVDAGNFGDALYCNVLGYHYELKAAQKLSQSDSSSLQNAGVNRIQFYKTDEKYIVKKVLGKILKGLDKENKQDEALAIIMAWNKGWPQEPEILGHALEKLLFDC
jgi:hypothetical protein